MTSGPQVLELVRHSPGVYRLSGASVPVVLQVSSWRSSATATVGGAEFALRTSGFLDRATTATPVDGVDPLVRLARKDCLVPGASAARWRTRMRMRGYASELSASEGRTMALEVGHGRRNAVSITVSGDWPDRDLVVLTAAFGLLMRRRDDESTAGGTAATVTAG